MAWRLRNTSAHPLRVDLRGGGTLYLRPGETSRAVREEQLYDNPYLPEWLERGIVRRVHVGIGEVHAAERAGHAERPAAAPQPRPERPDVLAELDPEPRAKLAAAGVRTSAELVEHAGGEADRRRLAERSGLDEASIARWTALADLVVISGIGRRFAELLGAAGVATVAELARREPSPLAKALEETNREGGFVRNPPQAEAVGDWIEQAKRLAS